MKKIFLVLFILFPFLVFAQGTGITKTSYTKAQADARFLGISGTATNTATLQGEDTTYFLRMLDTTSAVGYKKIATQHWVGETFAPVVSATFSGTTTVDDLVVTGDAGFYTNANLYSNLQILNKTGTGWNIVGLRDTTESNSRLTLQNIKNVQATGYVSAPVLTILTTDTVSGTYTVGSMFLRIVGGDTSMWVKIRMDGTLNSRWKKLTP